MNDYTTSAGGGGWPRDVLLQIGGVSRLYEFGFWSEPKRGVQSAALFRGSTRVLVSACVGRLGQNAGCERITTGSVPIIVLAIADRWDWNVGMSGCWSVFWVPRGCVCAEYLVSNMGAMSKEHARILLLFRLL